MKTLIRCICGRQALGELIRSMSGAAKKITDIRPRINLSMSCGFDGICKILLNSKEYM